MKIFDLFSSETKNYNQSLAPKSGICHNLSFLDVLLRRGYYDLAIHIAINYYRQAAPVATAINITAKSIADIEPVVQNVKTGGFVPNHPVLDLLENPNADSTYHEFMQRNSSFYSITGNVYINADGPVTNPPVSISVIPPQSVSVQLGDDGFPESYTVTTSKDSHVYKRRMIKGRFRYYENNIRELYQIKTFNPDSTNLNVLGLSPLQQISFEIEQYLAACTHNLSLLKRGSTITGIFESANAMDDDIYQRFKAQVNEYFSGENNAGRPFLSTDGVTFKPTQQSNKDMDFLELKKNVTTTIFNHLNIPLPMVSEDTMTMANMDAAKLNFYDNHILPLTKRFMQELTLLLMPRYAGSEDLIITFDESTIPALAPRRMENLKLFKEIGVNSTNELRNLEGFADATGGEEILAPSNLVPIAQVEENNE